VSRVVDFLTIMALDWDKIEPKVWRRKSPPMNNFYSSTNSSRFFGLVEIKVRFGVELLIKPFRYSVGPRKLEMLVETI
jgi:hypothetical protein